jgi:hypothetical protein
MDRSSAKWNHLLAYKYRNIGIQDDKACFLSWMVQQIWRRTFDMLRIRARRQIQRNFGRVLIPQPASWSWLSGFRASFEKFLSGESLFIPSNRSWRQTWVRYFLQSLTMNVNHAGVVWSDYPRTPEFELRTRSKIGKCWSSFPIMAFRDQFTDNNLRYIRQWRVADFTVSEQKCHI